jgi:hypothetical protein
MVRHSRNCDKGDYRVFSEYSLFSLNAHHGFKKRK